MSTALRASYSLACDVETAAVLPADGRAGQTDTAAEVDVPRSTVTG